MTRLNVDKQCRKWMHFIGNGSLTNQVNRLFHYAVMPCPAGHGPAGLLNFVQARLTIYSQS
jgi:hypothetical protein